MLHPTEISTSITTKESAAVPSTASLKVLIATFPHDSTAVIVDQALSRLGCEVTRWMLADFPGCQTITYSIGSEQPVAMLANGPGIGCDLAQVDVFWRRRFSSASVNTEVLHPDDVAAARAECNSLLTAVVGALAPNAQHINTEAAQKKSDNKLCQLMAAKQVGLAIPATLISNDATAIRAFIKRYASGEVVHKLLSGKTWEEQGIGFGSFTARVTVEQLPSDALLQAMPGCFQQCIAKHREIRAVFFGDYCLAAEINSQLDPDGRDDWRASSQRHGVWHAHTLAPEVVTKISNYMRVMGIVFGSVDLILQPDGTYVFLEMNEQGQFLWLESECPELGVLDAFCRLVLEGPTFASKPRLFPRVTLADPYFSESRIQKIIFEESASHRICNREGVVLFASA